MVRVRFEAEVTLTAEVEAVVIPAIGKTLVDPPEPQAAEILSVTIPVVQSHNVGDINIVKSLPLREVERLEHVALREAESPD